MRAKISLKNMKFFAQHGVLPEEFMKGNTFYVSVDIITDIENAAKNDDLEGTIDYSMVFDSAKEEMSRPSKLIENVAYRIQKNILAKTNKIEEMTIVVEKKRPPVAGYVDCSAVELKYVKPKSSKPKDVM